MLVAPVLSSEWPLWATFVAWGVGGLGMGLLFNPTTVSAMSFAAPGQEGMVGGQVSLADAVGFSLMGGIGGAMVALADRTSMSLTTALGINFALAARAGLRRHARQPQRRPRRRDGDGRRPGGCRLRLTGPLANRQ